MKKMKKLISLVLCVCMTGYTLPVFATQSIDDATMSIQKVMLSDLEMSELVGANGAVDAKVSDYTKGDLAQAVVVNRTSVGVNYSLTGTDINGNWKETIQSGYLSQNQALIVSGYPTAGLGITTVRAQVIQPSLKGMLSVDSSTSQ